MTGYGKRIRELRKKEGYTQTDLAERLHVAQRTVANWETESREPSLDIIAAIANVFGVSTEYLIRGEEPAWILNEEALPNGLVPIAKMSHHYIPMVGSVAAGVPIYMDECYDVYVDSPRQADFALRVEGDSMVPAYMDGDVVYIKAVSDVNDGQVCVVAVDDCCTLKHLYHMKDGVQLVSDNPKYAPMVYAGEDAAGVRVLGVPVGFTRMYRKEG